MIVAFRVDASHQIGTGHVMRCLTLAIDLRQAGASCIFLCRKHEGHLGPYIEAQGFAVKYLGLNKSLGLNKNLGSHSCFPGHGENNENFHQAWLGASWSIDAYETLQYLRESSVHWLVVDHYALDAQWEESVQGGSLRILVIDDLADRAHTCDILLDHNIGRSKGDYSGLVKKSTMLLLGAEFALLREEFSQWRVQSLARRRQKEPLRNLLVSMGGVDQKNMTGAILAILDSCLFAHGLYITVVLGATCPWISAVRSQAKGMELKVTVIVAPPNMAEILAESDLAIGAAGVSALERSVLGLPSLVLIIAENQQRGAEQLERVSAALIETIETLPTRLEYFLTAEPGQKALHRMSNTASNVTLGLGAPKVRDAMWSKCFET